MAEGLAWIPGTGSNLVEALNSVVDNWLVECPADFQALYSRESCRELRANSSSPGSQNLLLNPLPDNSNAAAQGTVVVTNPSTLNTLMTEDVEWERSSSLMFRTRQPRPWGGQCVAFWKVVDRGLAREILWRNAISGTDGLVSCMLSGDCDPLLLQQLALKVEANRGFVDGGLLLDDSWEELTASCTLGVWFGRPDWDFLRSVLVTSAHSGILDRIRSLAISGGAKETPGFHEAISYWSRDYKSGCVCNVDIGAELLRHAR
jgi:hypothetical protein